MMHDPYSVLSLPKTGVDRDTQVSPVVQVLELPISHHSQQLLGWQSKLGPHAGSPKQAAPMPPPLLLAQSSPSLVRTQLVGPSA